MKLNKFVWCVGLLLASVLVAQAQQDTTPPTLVSFDFSPKQVDTSSGPAAITLSFQVTDNLSGVFYSYALFNSPSGTVYQYGTWLASTNLVSGTTLNGVLQGQLSFPAFSESGTWTIGEVSIFDKTGNRAIYTPAQLQALGFPTTLLTPKPT